MVLLRFMSVCGLCRQTRAVFRLVAPLAWLMVLLYSLIGALMNREWLTTPQLSLAKGYDGLMSELGFVFDPVLYPHAHHDIEDLPVFVATINSDELQSFHRFLGSFRLYFRQKKLVVYDFGLTAEELRLVRVTLFENIYVAASDSGWVVSAAALLQGCHASSHSAVLPARLLFDTMAIFPSSPACHFSRFWLNNG